MVSAKALVMRDQKSLGMLDFDEVERPIGMQLFGNSAETLAQAAEIVQATGCDVIDLNLGCPARKIINDGGGSKLATDQAKLKHVLTAMRKKIVGPFTIKLRAGWNDKDLSAVTIAKMAQDLGVDAITIHGRTTAQGYRSVSRWEFITEIKQAVQIPVIGNGDVKTASDAYAMMQETGCDAVMTGRAAFHAPWIFRDFIDGNDQVPSPQQIEGMIFTHYDLAKKYYGDAQGIKLMRKFICSYTKGLRDGAKLRNDLVRLTDWAIIEKIIRGFFGGAPMAHSG